MCAPRACPIVQVRSAPAASAGTGPSKPGDESRGPPETSSAGDLGTTPFPVDRTNETSRDDGGGQSTLGRDTWAVRPEAVIKQLALFPHLETGKNSEPPSCLKSYGRSLHTRRTAFTKCSCVLEDSGSQLGVISPFRGCVWCLQTLGEAQDAAKGPARRGPPLIKGRRSAQAEKACVRMGGGLPHTLEMEKEMERQAGLKRKFVLCVFR